MKIAIENIFLPGPKTIVNKTTKCARRYSHHLSLSMAVYRERRKKYPMLPKSKAHVHESINNMAIETSKSEPFTLSNDTKSRIIIFQCVSTLEVLRKVVN